MVVGYINIWKFFKENGTMAIHKKEGLGYKLKKEPHIKMPK
jgi:hypothetical protein